MVSRPDKRNQASTKALVLIVVGVLLATYLYMASMTTKSTPNEFEAVAAKFADSSSIQTGAVNDIPYYHCSGAGSDVKHLVLLHGAKFTKEDWKTSGLLDGFCRIPNLSVSAMDLPVSAGYQELVDLLHAMQLKQLVSLPVALITPSASGKTITDWMKNGDVSKLPTYVYRWIPVATGSVSSASAQEVSSLKDSTSIFSIFAIYGNQDSMGKKVTETLRDLAGAKTLELKGGHPCYLDSPDAFLSAVSEDLGVSK
jgi:pimeloyl-ACP methyl ester carboxylesterase